MPIDFITLKMENVHVMIIGETVNMKNRYLINTIKNFNDTGDNTKTNIPRFPIDWFKRKVVNRL